MSFVGRCRSKTGHNKRCRNLVTIGLHCEFHAGMLADEVRAIARTIEAANATLERSPVLDVFVVDPRGNTEAYRRGVN